MEMNWSNNIKNWQNLFFNNENHFMEMKNLTNKQTNKKWKRKKRFVNNNPDCIICYFVNVCVIYKFWMNPEWMDGSTSST